MGYSVEWLVENEIVYAKFWVKGDAIEKYTTTNGFSARYVSKIKD